MSVEVSDVLRFRTIIREEQRARFDRDDTFLLSDWKPRFPPWWQCLTCYKHYEGYPGKERCDTCQIIFDRERRQRLREKFANRHR